MSMVDHDTTVLRSGNLYDVFLPCCGEFLFSKLTVWKARCLRNILLRVVMDCLSPLLAASSDHQTGGNLSIRMTEAVCGAVVFVVPNFPLQICRLS